MSRASSGALALPLVALLALSFLSGCGSADDLFDYGPSEEQPTPGGGGMGGSEPGGGPIEPGGEYCSRAMVWDAEWAALEDGVHAIVNQRRSEGAVCGSRTLAAAEPLAMRADLQCAARMHSLDMVERDYFSHDNPDGDGPGERLDLAGYSGRALGENIAGGSATAEGVMTQWMESPGHCENIMSPNYALIGVGYQPGGEYRHMWTQTFGSL